MSPRNSAGAAFRVASFVAAVLVTSWLHLVLSTGSSLAHDQRYSATEVHMGSEFHIVCYAPDQDIARRAMRAAFARIGELDHRLSDYLSASELSQLSLSSPHEAWRHVGPDLWNILVEAQTVSRLSDGAFDITVGPLSRLWRRGRRRQMPPTEQLIAQARAAVGYQFLELRELESDAAGDPQAQRQVRLTRSEMRLDVGGIAKGYAVEEALRTMQRWGVERALVNGGGDIAAGAAPPGELGWRVGVAPLQADAGPSRFLRLTHRSVATSGDSWQFLELDGRRYSHILDPRTGYGVTDRSTVTVIARRGSLADALASAVSVLGPDAGLELARHWDDVELLVLMAAEDDSAVAPDEGDGGRSARVREWSSPGFARYVESSGGE